MATISNIQSDDLKTHIESSLVSVSAIITFAGLIIDIAAAAWDAYSKNTSGSQVTGAASNMNRTGPLRWYLSQDATKITAVNLNQTATATIGVTYDTLIGESAVVVADQVDVNTINSYDMTDFINKYTGANFIVYDKWLDGQQKGTYVNEHIMLATFAVPDMTWGVSGEPTYKIFRDETNQAWQLFTSTACASASIKWTRGTDRYNLWEVSPSSTGGTDKYNYSYTLPCTEGLDLSDVLKDLEITLVVESADGGHDATRGDSRPSIEATGTGIALNLSGDDPSPL